MKKYQIVIWVSIISLILELLNVPKFWQIGSYTSLLVFGILWYGIKGIKTKGRKSYWEMVALTEEDEKQIQ